MKEAQLDPSDLLISGRSPWQHRIRRSWLRLRRNGPLRFILLFVLFVLLGALVEVVLEGSAQGSPFAHFFNALWFTVVTITTVGYGDITPQTPLAQAWAMVEMLVGIGLVGVITGSVASVLVESNRKHALGLVPVRGLRNHVVVCGWKQDIRNILLGILAADPRMRAVELVLVTTQQPTVVADLRRERRLRGLHYVFGSHTDTTVLRMARVDLAERVIILADEAGSGDEDDTDSRTVLAATAIETVNNVVYTCAEILKPHYVPYLRPAGVEDVVLSNHNAAALISAASLGEGISNVVGRFFPEGGEQLRIMPVPDWAEGGAYGELAAHFAARGMLPLGLLENTGRLHDRKREQIAQALRQPEYPLAVASLRAASNMVSNVPRLIPGDTHLVRPHSRALALLPAAALHQLPTEDLGDPRQHRRGGQDTGHLLICGWKRDMAGLLREVLRIHRAAGKPLQRVTVLADLPPVEAGRIRDDGSLAGVRIMSGDPTDPRQLQAADVRHAARALVLTDPEAERNSREADARNVMISFAINDQHPSLYKCVELMNPNFAEHLHIANVEEIIATRQYERMMLVQGSLGIGLSSVVGHLLNPSDPGLRVMSFPPAVHGGTFAAYHAQLAAEGHFLIGVVEYAGNNHARKQEYLFETQSEPRIRTAIERLQRLKSIRSNRVLLNPGNDYRPGRHTRAVVIPTIQQPSARS